MLHICTSLLVNPLCIAVHSHELLLTADTDTVASTKHYRLTMLGPMNTAINCSLRTSKRLIDRVRMLKGQTCNKREICMHQDSDLS